MPPYSLGVLIALVVLVVSVVGLVLLLAAQLESLPVAGLVFVLCAALAVARLT